MAELRRKGLTFSDIGARLGCSERTARRYSGQLEPRLELPRGNTKSDPDALREQLGERFAQMVWKEWSRWPSAAFVNECNRQFDERLAATMPETLRLLADDPRMRWQLFVEIAIPLYRDFRTYQSVADFMGQFPDSEPRYWRPPHERKDQVENGIDEIP